MARLMGTGSRGRHDPYEALRYRDYRNYLIAACLYQLGRGMLSLAVSWEIYQITHSAAALGLIGLMHAIPLFLFSLPAGQWADYYDRKKIVTGCAFSMAVFSACLAWVSANRSSIPAIAPIEWVGGVLESIIGLFERHSGSAEQTHYDPSLPYLYLLILLIAVGKVIGGPSRISMVPLLLPLKAFPNAITWNRSVFQIAKMAGPVLGGFLVAWVDFATVYLLNAVFALIMCIILVSISFDRAQKRPIESPTWGSLLEGVRFVHQHKAILAVISIDMLAILLGGTRALLPIYADSILGIGAVGLGWLRGAEGVGAFVAALFLAHAPPMKKPGVIIIWSVAFFGMATLAFGVSSTLLLSLGMLFLMGAFDNISAVVRQCVVQLMSPDALRGRVAAVNSIFIGSSNELGAIRAGFMAALIGPVAAVAVGAIGTVASAVVVARVWPALGKIGDLSRLRAK